MLKALADLWSLATVWLGAWSRSSVRVAADVLNSSSRERACAQHSRRAATSEQQSWSGYSVVHLSLIHI
eukprot:12443886-Alexandrium_andersonii.AAC.1